MDKNILFEIKTPLGVLIRVTAEYWEYIVTIKHRPMKGKDDLVKEILTCPDEIRRSKMDADVHLYYKFKDKLYCVICKHIGNEGYIITSYPTDKVKEGEIIWTK
ncbi:MAG: DUF4258 domain-containing protein [Nitrospirota bacterium]